jgi:hypothetical protein
MDIPRRCRISVEVGQAGGTGWIDLIRLAERAVTLVD